MPTFISESEESHINNATDEIVAALAESGSQPDRDKIYNEVVCHYIPKARW